MSVDREQWRTGIEIPINILYIPNFAINRAMESMVVRRRQAEDGDTRILERLQLGRPLWEIKQVRDVEILSFNPGNKIS
jgi:hypothetical protein